MPFTVWQLHKILTLVLCLSKNKTKIKIPISGFTSLLLHVFDQLEYGFDLVHLFAMYWDGAMTYLSDCQAAGGNCVTSSSDIYILFVYTVDKYSSGPIVLLKQTISFCSFS